MIDDQKCAIKNNFLNGPGNNVFSRSGFTVILKEYEIDVIVLVAQRDAKLTGLKTESDA